MPSSIGGLPTPNGAAAPRVRQDIEDLAAAVDLASTPVLASTTARDAAYDAAITAGKVGMRCYITNRAGYCCYVHTNNSGKAWVWEPQHNVLLDGHRLVAADATGTTPCDIILMPSVTLPPGNRRVLVRASAVVQALTGACTPRAYVEGPGIASPETYLQTSLPAVGVEGTVSREWEVVVSGAVAWNMRGINTVAGASVRFVGSILQVIDRGPA